jgi:hypothetical protein
MKTIIAGSRDIIDGEELQKAIKDSDFEITEVVCGCARGVDELGLIWATYNDIPVKKFPANWKMGKMAGRERNIEMARYADALIAVMLKEGTAGTSHMIKVAKMQGLKVFIRKV